MENRTKQLNFNLTTPTEIHGQLGPEDLSPNKNVQKKIFNNINNDDNSFSKSVQIKNDYNGKRLDEILAHQIESDIWLVNSFYFTHNLFNQQTIRPCCKFIEFTNNVLFDSFDNHHIKNSNRIPILSKHR